MHEGMAEAELNLEPDPVEEVVLKKQKHLTKTERNKKKRVHDESIERQKKRKKKIGCGTLIGERGWAKHKSISSRFI